MKIIETVKEKTGNAFDAAKDFCYDHGDDICTGFGYGIMIAGVTFLAGTVTWAYGNIAGKREMTQYLCKNFPDEMKTIIQKEALNTYKNFLTAAK